MALITLRQKHVHTLIGMAWIAVAALVTVVGVGAWGSEGTAESIAAGMLTGIGFVMWAVVLMFVNDQYGIVGVDR